ncbi:flagellar synthesis protein FlgN [Sulfuriferula plumbiphila]|uniref:Flagellar synthesis protein FlgN n=1 Tax=Sulfuriferula plumbiphila TaxID=171865 RepID=A0A512L4G0_9PROT|nr:flagellar protein FlgN [Sulfuriferula plumbiphila]BBP03819.1 flagellar synthesis protein FlgN [Sulfuriferula plumbiphila]GEP29352.1 flagellar synthesis protein FlgN [Sulfuriferula plumbiphila]
MDTRLMDTLNEERDAMHCLLGLIQQEQALLLEADIDRLSAVTDEKARTVARMTELANTRLHALATAGYPQSEAGMQAWLASQTAGSAAETWAELLALTQSAKEMNRVNGLLINTHLTRNQVALNVLHGADQRSGFYGPDGQSKISVAARNLVIG